MNKESQTKTPHTNTPLNSALDGNDASLSACIIHYTAYWRTQGLQQNPIPSKLQHQISKQALQSAEVCISYYSLRAADTGTTLVCRESVYHHTLMQYFTCSVYSLSDSYYSLPGTHGSIIQQSMPTSAMNITVYQCKHQARMRIKPHNRQHTEQDGLYRPCTPHSGCKPQQLHAQGGAANDDLETQQQCSTMSLGCILTHATHTVHAGPEQASLLAEPCLYLNIVAVAFRCHISLCTLAGIAC